MYVYIKSEPSLWTVGFFEGGKWHAESDHDSALSAAARVHYLNGQPQPPSSCNVRLYTRAEIVNGTGWDRNVRFIVWDDIPERV